MYYKSFWIMLLANIILLTTLVMSVSVCVKRNGDIRLLQNELRNKEETIIANKQELHICEMESNEWKELFYSSIDFDSNNK